MIKRPLGFVVTVGNKAQILLLAGIEALLNDDTTVPVVTLVEATGEVMIAVPASVEPVPYRISTTTDIVVTLLPTILVESKTIALFVKGTMSTVSSVVILLESTYAPTGNR